MSVEHEDEELSGGEGVVRDDKVGKNMFGCWHVILDKPRSMEKGLRSLDFFLFLFSSLAWLHRYRRSSLPYLLGIATAAVTRLGNTCVG